MRRERKTAREVRRLIRAGGNVDAEDDGAPDGGTALHEATRRGSADIVRLLLKGGANANAADRKGWTALHMAVLRIMTEEAGVLTKGIALCEMLLKHGADPNLRNADRMSTALHLAYVLKDADVQLVVTGVAARFIRSAVLDDELIVETALVATKRVRAQWAQQIYLDGELVVCQRINFATVNTEGRPIRMPEALVASLDQIDAPADWFSKHLPDLPL